MRNVLRRFDGEAKIGRGRVMPFLKTFRLLQRIKRAVDFDRRDLPARMLELALLHEALRIKAAAPSGVLPT